MKRKNHRTKKSTKPAQTEPTEEPKELKNAPHTFVIHRGLQSTSTFALSRDFRKIMEPFTARGLKERKQNKMKDFVSLSGIFHVSHMCLFSLTSQTLSLKIIRMPKGPTLTFKVHQYTLAKDVISVSKKQFDTSCFLTPPLVILNSFSGEGRHLKLMASTFQNMFPPINLKTVKLGTLKRCVLLSYNPVSKLIDMRHYAITVVPVLLNKGVKKVVTRHIPNLAKYDDISEFVEKGHLLSESEFDDEETHVILPQTMSKGNLEDNKSSLRLQEIGPRLTLRLMKIEDELLTGEVLYHDYLVKDAIEVERLKKKREEKRRTKESRKQTQEANKSKKEKLKLEHKAKTSGKITETDKILLKDAEDAIENDSEEDDSKYYIEEIGKKPEKELFDGTSSTRKRPFIPKGSTYSLKPKIKKQKTDDDKNNWKKEDEYEGRKFKGGKGKNFKDRDGRKDSKGKGKKKSGGKGGKGKSKSKSGSRKR